VALTEAPAQSASAQDIYRLLGGVILPTDARPTNRPDACVSGPLLWEMKREAMGERPLKLLCDQVGARSIVELVASPSGDVLGQIQLLVRVAPRPCGDSPRSLRHRNPIRPWRQTAICGAAHSPTVNRSPGIVLGFSATSNADDVNANCQYEEQEPHGRRLVSMRDLYPCTRSRGTSRSNSQLPARIGRSNLHAQIRRPRRTARYEHSDLTDAQPMPWRSYRHRIRPLQRYRRAMPNALN
jgi:hypothetical protein